MNKKLVNFIIKKYLKFDHKNPFISISAILAFVGVSVGVMVLILAMAIMNGTAKEFEDKLFTMNYPLSIYPEYENTVNKDLLEDLEEKFPNMLFSPYLSSQVMLQGDRQMSGGMIFGVDSKRESLINKIYKKSADELNTINKYDLIIGQGIKDNLMIFENQKLT